MTRAERIAEYKETPVRFTAEEFLQLAQHPPISEWVGKVELIEGEIIRMSAANIPHWMVQQDVSRQLTSIFAALGPEWLVGPEPTVRFARRTVRLPDVGVFRNAKIGPFIFEVASLFMAVEIADTTLRNDLGRKRAGYAEAGVPHYWVVDVNGRKTHVMAEPEAGDYGAKRVIPFGEPIEVPGADAVITLA
ncbi:Uma2 family endonuclease [Sphingomonas lenta]|nr:Uma2 family endonuclease [Sphingomonas lenta]